MDATEPTRPTTYVAWAWALRDDTQIVRTNLAILLTLGSRLDPITGAGWVSTATLETDTGYGERSIRTATALARQLGYLTQTERGRMARGGRRRASSWQLTLPIVDTTARGHRPTGTHAPVPTGTHAPVPPGGYRHPRAAQVRPGEVGPVKQDPGSASSATSDARGVDIGDRPPNVIDLLSALVTMVDRAQTTSTPPALAPWLTPEERAAALHYRAGHAGEQL